MTWALRALAVVMAIAAFMDPAFVSRRPWPAHVDIHTAPTSPAASIRDRLIADLDGDIAVGSGETPAAVVLIGDGGEIPLPDGVPISVVSAAPLSGPNVRLVRAAAPDVVLTGQVGVVTAQFEAIGLADRSSAIDLEQDGIRLARVEHRWTRDAERFTTELRYAPPAPGSQQITVVAQPIAGELSDIDNAADLPIVAAARTLRVAIYEPRPSWAVGFVRRALESDPVFDLSSLVRPSPGLEVRAGAPPRRLTAAALAPFEAVLVGAPDELTDTEVNALDAFAGARGGVVIAFPDRRPSGPYVRLFPRGGFDEVLLEKPSRGSAGFSASELALPRGLDAGGVALASVTWQGGTRAVVASWPRGAGLVIFSGALDAWRYRAREEQAFARFWSGTIANVAASAQRPLSVSVQPALAAPGELITVRATVRTIRGDGSAVPVEASLVAADGSLHAVRLWPLAEPGAFEGLASAPPAGRYEVRASAAGGLTASAPVQVVDGARRPPSHEPDVLRLVAGATGGVVTDGSDLQPLERHLRSLRRQDGPATRHPTRSPWWGLTFAAALCGEWALRRRGGAR